MALVDGGRFAPGEYWSTMASADIDAAIKVAVMRARGPFSLKMKNHRTRGQTM